MTLVRVSLFSILICTISAFAQNSRPSLTGSDLKKTETSKISVSPMDRIHIDEFRMGRNYSPFKSEAKNDPITLNFDAAPGSDDGACFTMRTYVVARDNKHSDATHLVGYSTCQKASRYRLRTTELEVTPVTR